MSRLGAHTAASVAPLPSRLLLRRTTRSGAAEAVHGRIGLKITDLRCAIVGKNPIARIVTDVVTGYGETESCKPCPKPHVLAEREARHLPLQDATFFRLEAHR